MSLWGDRKKRESDQARGDVAHQDPWRAGAHSVFASLRKGRGLQKGFLCCVLDELSCRKKNEVAVKSISSSENIVYGC